MHGPCPKISGDWAALPGSAFFGGSIMALHFPPEWLDENLPDDFDPSDLSPYRALERHADFVAEQLESPPLIMIDLDGDSVEKIRQTLRTPEGPVKSCGCSDEV
jgi:hypothetical protein